MADVDRSPIERRVSRLRPSLGPRVGVQGAEVVVTSSRRSHPKPIASLNHSVDRPASEGSRRKLVQRNMAVSKTGQNQVAAMSPIVSGHIHDPCATLSTHSFNSSAAIVMIKGAIDRRELRNSSPLSIHMSKPAKTCANLSGLGQCRTIHVIQLSYIRAITICPFCRSAAQRARPYCPLRRAYQAHRPRLNGHAMA